MKTIIRMLAGIIGSALAVATVTAKTVYVDGSFGPGGTGTEARPYDTITKALTDFNADTVVVMPGRYEEALQIKKNVIIRGYDGPHTTVLDGTRFAANQDLVVIDPAIFVTLEGLKLAGGRAAIRQSYKNSSLRLHNCVICDAGNGVAVDFEGDGASYQPIVEVHNCVFFGNRGNGMQFSQTFPEYSPQLTAYNNVFVKNGGHGFAVYSTARVWDRDPGRFTLDYNVAIENGAGNYNEPFAPGKYISVGNNSFEAEPGFVGDPSELSSKDFRLTPTSPCRDQGNPALGFQDADGTRNDIGAYGGPGARTFYTNPNDGPIVREVTIDKGMVPKGETFTIRAKGAVR